MTVNDVNNVSEQSSSNVPLRSLYSIFNEMYPAFARSDPVPDGWYTGLIRWRPDRDSTEYQRIEVPIYVQSRTPDRSVNHEAFVPLPRHSLIAPQRSRWSPMVQESPDARPAAPADQSGSLESPSRTSPLERRTQGSSNRANEDVTLPLECEARVLSRIVDIVGMELLDFENFTAGGYEDCDQAIQRARELSSLESAEGRDSLFCLCGWHIYHGEHEKHDRFLSAFAVERFRQKHNGVVGDSMPAQAYNRYLGYMKIIDGLKLCIDNNEPDYRL